MSTYTPYTVTLSDGTHTSFQNIIEYDDALEEFEDSFTPGFTSYLQDRRGYLLDRHEEPPE